VRRRRRSEKTRRAARRLQKVHMDIGHGDSVSPGGSRCCLVLVDDCSRQTHACGLNGLSGVEIQDCLFRFAVDCGGWPETIQCDCDSRFLGGAVRRLLHSKGVRIRSSPPHRHSQNGVVERTWATTCRMARCMPTEAQPPKSCWCWAVREATQRLNLTPAEGPDGNLTTPFELFWERKPDGRVLFSFGCVGCCRRDSPAFEAESLPGVALGRSDCTNGLVFCNPLNRTFSVSSDCTLDPGKAVKSQFPRAIYDGGLMQSRCILAL